MDEKSLYVHILNLTAPGQVKSLSLDENAGSVTVIVNGVILIPASSQGWPRKPVYAAVRIVLLI